MLTSRQGRTLRKNARWLVPTLLIAVSCGSDGSSDDDDDDAGSSGVSDMSGGSAGTKGGSSSRGGSTAGKAGNVSSSGNGGNGGTLGGNGGSSVQGGTGGSSDAGASAVAGASGEDTGGSSATGGTGATGGSDASGGTSGLSGSGGSLAGSGGSGGSGEPVQCHVAFGAGDAGYVFSLGVDDCWHGYAYTARDASGTTMTPADFSSCTDELCALCVNGTLADDPAAYASVGFNVNQAEDMDAARGTMVPGADGLTVSFSSVGTTELRVELQGTSEQWCYSLGLSTSGTVTIPYSSFTTACWDTLGGTAYAREPIKAVDLYVTGTESSVGYSFCLSSIRDE